MAFLACVVAACKGGEIIPGVSDSTFVATMADLRRAEAIEHDAAALAASRKRILQQRGLTPERMESAARKLGEDPDRAVAIWQAIERRAVQPEAPTTSGAARVR